MFSTLGGLREQNVNPAEGPKFPKVGGWQGQPVGGTFSAFRFFDFLKIFDQTPS